MTKVNEVIRESFLFHSLNQREIGLLARLAEERRCRSGQTVVREGEPGDCLYLVRTGGVNITKGREHSFLSYLGPGGCFGEMALFEEEGVRSASAVAAADSVLLSIDREKFWGLMESHPKMANKIYREIVNILIERLAITSADLAMLMKQRVLSQEKISALTARP